MQRYPRIFLQSKNNIAKRLASEDFPYKDSLATINDVLKNFDGYWYDSKRSKPNEGKYVRGAAKSPGLRKILSLINEKILKPHDNMVPNFIFGGISKKNNIQADRRLLGKERGRTLLKLDIKSFFEQISEQRVFYLFYKKCGCSVRASRILASLCCVPHGAKGSISSEKILARGFATSSRLALWCNLDTFQHLDWKIKQKLNGHDPMIAIYVDDIGITASRVDDSLMEDTKQFAIKILEEKDKNQKLPVHRDGKTKITRFADGAEHLGIKLGRNRLSLGWKARSNIDKAKLAVKKSQTPEEKFDLIKKYRAHQIYKRQVEKSIDGASIIRKTVL